MKVGSLFSGVGGFELAFSRAGFETAWMVEKEPFCQKVLRHRFPGVPLYDDVREVGKHNLESVDVITAGWPCQDLSVAGKRMGLKGHRSGLFHEAVRIVRELRPTFFLGENVPGLFSSAGGWDFAAVLDEMAESGALDIAWSVLDAKWFGVPQRRRRVFVVCDFGGFSAGEVLSISEGLPGNIEESGEEGEGVASSTEEGASGDSSATRAKGTTQADTAEGNEAAEAVAQTTGEDRSPRRGGVETHEGTEGVGFIAAHDTGQGWWNQDTIAGTLRAEGENRPSRPSNIVGTLRGGGKRGYRVDAEGAAGGHLIAGTLPHDYYKQGGNAMGEMENGVIAHALTDEQSGQRLDPTDQTLVFDWQSGGDVRHNISSESSSALHAGQTPAVAFAENQRGELRTSDIHPQLTTGGGKPGQGFPAVASPMAVRRLTPLETERLQGFPDDWTNIPGASDSARYRAMGNAVCVPVVEWIARRLMAVMENDSTNRIPYYPREAKEEL